MTNIKRDEALVIARELKRRQKLSRTEKKRQAFLRNKPTRLESPCILFDGCLTPQGYGSMRRNGKSWLAHRYYWTEVYGTIPIRMHVLHRCDNPPCIRVSHLYLGTQKDSMKAMREKNRQALSSNRSDLEPDQVLDIYRWIKGGIDTEVIAEKFQVERSVIYRIRNERNFRYLLP